MIKNGHGRKLSRRLLPLAVDTDKTAKGTGQTDDAVVQEADPAETGDGNADIAKVAEELLLGGGALTGMCQYMYHDDEVTSAHDQIGERKGVDVNLHGDGLALNNTLTLLQIHLGCSHTQLAQSIQLTNDAEHDTDGPESVGLLLEALGVIPLAEADGVRNSSGIASQVTGITQLATDRGVPQDGVHGFGVACGGGGLEVLDKLASAEDLAHEAELLLEGVPRGDLVRGAVGAEEVPGVEAGKILQDAHELVATEGCGHVAQVVRDRRVVDEGVGDHDCGDGDRWVTARVVSRDGDAKAR